MAGVAAQPRARQRSPAWTALVCLAVGAATGMLLRPPHGPPPLPPPLPYTPFSLPLSERHFAYELARMDVPTLVTKLRRLVGALEMCCSCVCHHVWHLVRRLQDGYACWLLAHLPLIPAILLLVFPHCAVDGPAGTCSAVQRHTWSEWGHPEPRLNKSRPAPSACRRH